MTSTPRHSAIRPHGVFIISDPDLPHEVHRDVMKCCHCQRLWVVVPGSGRVRGFCMKCHQVTCGAEACDPCVPFERKLDLYEAGKLASL